MKKLMLVLAIATTAAAQAAAPQTVLACWDGTFAYDTFRIEKTDKRLYASLQGSMLVERGKSFYLSNRQEQLIKINDWRLRDHLVVSFRLDQCQLDEAKRTATCESGDLMQDVHAQP